MQCRDASLPNARKRLLTIKSLFNTPACLEAKEAPTYPQGQWISL